jgi:antiviral helicase SKI2
MVDDGLKRRSSKERRGWRADLVRGAMPSSDLSLEKLFDSLRKPSSDGQHDLLADLGLASLPSRSQIETSLVDRFLTPKPAIPRHWLNTWQEHWFDEARERDVKRFLHIDRAESRTSLEWDWEGLEGKVKGYKEVCSPVTFVQGSPVCLQ